MFCRVNRDLGQFERFRRVFHTPYYSVLLSHVQHATLSSLQVRCTVLACCVLKSHRTIAWQASLKQHVMYDACCMQISELQWKQRVWVKGYKGNEEGVFEFLMVKRLGGRYDGTWFTSQLTCDGCPGGSLSV